MGIHYFKIIDRKMATVEASSLSQAEHDELCCSYAALTLHDDGVEITAEKLAKVIKDSGNTVEPYWPMLFAKALKNANVGEMLTAVASAGPAPGAAAGGAGPAAAAEAPKEEKKEEVVEEVDMGGLFGDDDNY